MTHRTRKALFSFFVLLFIIITPLVCLYAAGYQLGTNFKIQKTGILVIKTEPKGAQVKLESDAPKNVINLFLKNDSFSTPSKIKNVYPGKYLINLSKDGYWPWTEKLEIYAGQSAYIENITLFKKNLPISLSTGRFLNLKQSPDKINLLAMSERKVSIINLNNFSVADFSASSTNLNDISEISWLLNNKNFIVGSSLFNLENNKIIIDLNDLTGDKVSKIRRSEVDENEFYYISKNELMSYNIVRKERTITGIKPVGEYFVKDDNLFFVEKTKNQAILNIFRISDGKLLRKISLPNSDYKFIDKNLGSNLIILSDNLHKNLYLVDPFAEIKPIAEIINNATMAEAVNDSSLIYGNNNEIWLLNINDGNKYLITRISDTIKSIIAFNGQYIIYQTDKSVNVLQLSKNHQILKLIELNKIINPIIDETKSNLYFIGSIGNNSGIYKLEIQ